MRYDLKLFQFILNLMEIMCLVHESMKCSVGWSKLMAIISSNNKRNWNRQQYVGKALKSRAIVGH